MLDRMTFEQEVQVNRVALLCAQCQSDRSNEHPVVWQMVVGLVIVPEEIDDFKMALIQQEPEVINQRLGMIWAPGFSILQKA